MYLNELSLLSQKSEVPPKSKGDVLQHAIAGKAYLLVAEGNLLVNDLPARKGDGVAISDEASITLTAQTEAELLVIEVPGLIDAR